jgi:pyridoxine 4-dehydrogenase
MAVTTAMAIGCVAQLVHGGGSATGAVARSMRGALIGRALSPFADDIVIGNKVGARRGPAGEWLTDSRPQTVRTQVEDALLDMHAGFTPLTHLRLRGDSQAPGNAPAEEVPLEEALGALVKLRDEGKIRHIGLSGASPEMLERSRRSPPFRIAST